MPRGRRVRARGGAELATLKTQAPALCSGLRTGTGPGAPSTQTATWDAASNPAQMTVAAAPAARSPSRGPGQLGVPSRQRLDRRAPDPGSTDGFPRSHERGLGVRGGVCVFLEVPLWSQQLGHLWYTCRCFSLCFVFTVKPAPSPPQQLLPDLGGCRLRWPHSGWAHLPSGSREEGERLGLERAQGWGTGRGSLGCPTELAPVPEGLGVRPCQGLRGWVARPNWVRGPRVFPCPCWCGAISLPRGPVLATS